MRKRRNITEDDGEDTAPGGYGSTITIETLQSLVMVGVVCVCMYVVSRNSIILWYVFVYLKFI